MQPVAIQNSLNAASRPGRLQRIALINPTKFLGNLLLNGQYIQHLAKWCHAQDSQLLVVLDSRFEQLFGPAFSVEGIKLCYYPRQALKQGRIPWLGVRQWWQCVSEIRRFAADLAFTIEEDSVAHRLTHLSGAKVRVSCSEARYHFGFDAILDIKRQGRCADTPSIWHVTGDIFSSLGLPVPEHISYPQLNLGSGQYQIGGDASRPMVVMHAGASKRYKQWPIENFVELAKSIVSEGYRLSLIGAGPDDAQINAGILKAVGPANCQDYCNQLSLIDLASVIRQAHFMIGNDSGPSHLGSALGIPGVVLFGPTDLGLWKPLGAQTSVLHHKELCQSDCTRHHCRKGYACLKEVSAEEVMAKLKTHTDQL
ncbi:glycosyltransferase family 9 protein [Pseudohongiella nitratireducens]|uniref:glycosyltransferase family 9 protein n=1 Tax=Pseudohongiella nitratireducens TaxID=1768907 RepID=UPI0030EB8C65|tara:strand:- start:2183 stop:3286 length:1104 start_codon:yes stop_codon:yes gene_type:complete